MPPGPTTRTSQQSHPRGLTRGVPEEDEVAARDERPTGGEQRAGEPRRAQASDQRRDEGRDPDDRHEEDSGHRGVGREPQCARRDPRVDRALDSLAAPDDAFGAVVEPYGGGTDAADHLLGEPGRLFGDRVPELGARGDVVQSLLRLVAREHLVRQLDRVWACERRGHEALQLAARRKLRHDAFEDVVADERARELLGERAGQRSVDDASDLGRGQDLVHRLLDRPAPRARGRARREERRAPGRTREPGALFFVLRGHGWKASTRPSRRVRAPLRARRRRAGRRGGSREAGTGGPRTSRRR